MHKSEQKIKFKYNGRGREMEMVMSEALVETMVMSMVVKTHGKTPD